jgi:hypothetical protein
VIWKGREVINGLQFCRFKNVEIRAAKGMKVKPFS